MSKHLPKGTLRRTDPSPQRVAVLAFDRANAPPPMRAQHRCWARATPYFTVRVVAMEGGPCAQQRAFTSPPSGGWRCWRWPMWWSCPGWRDVNERAPEGRAASLARSPRAWRRAGGAVPGAFMLAQAGLLDTPGHHALGPRGRTGATVPHGAGGRQRALCARRLPCSPRPVRPLRLTAATICLRNRASATVANHGAHCVGAGAAPQWGQAQFIECAVPPQQPRSERMRQLLEALLST